MFRYSFFIFIVLSCFASSHDTYLRALNEKEPNVLFDGCVNVVTGNFVLNDEIIVLGKEPVKIKKSYFSLINNDKRYRDEKSNDEYILAGWFYKNELKAYCIKDRIDIIEPEGIGYYFQIPNFKSFNDLVLIEKKTKKKKKTKDTNEVQTLLYQNFYYTPKCYAQNVFVKDMSRASVRTSGVKELFVDYSDGRKKYYKRYDLESSEYLLQKETLLNQNKILYFYDEHGNLIEIRTTDSLENIVYAWAKFDYSHPEKNYREKDPDKYDFIIETSDNKRYEFKHNNYYPVISKKERSRHPFFFLESFISNKNKQSLKYHLEYKKTHPLLKEVILPDKRTKEIEYYLLGNKNPGVDIQFFDIKDYHFERVKTLKEMVNGQSLDIAYRFYYDKADNLNTTTIYDNKNNKIVYFYNLNGKIEKIKRYDNEICINEEIFVWDNFSLVSKAFLDKNKKPIFAKRYFYDSKNNLMEERVYGDISGKGKALILDANNLPADGCEHVSKTYRYTLDERNLLNTETEGDLIKRYSYLPGTDLVTSKFVVHKGAIKKRHFYEYDENYLLVKEIVDDGSHIYQDDVTDASFRKTKYFYYKKTFPFIGFLESFEEKYLDFSLSQEKLLKKETYKYSKSGKITKKDIYDSDGKYRYSYTYVYDDFDNLISETDPMGRESTYKYDPAGKKTHENLKNKICKEYVYDTYDKLVCENATKMSVDFYEKNYLYDLRNNKTGYIDPEKNLIKYEYDNLDNLISVSKNRNRKAQAIEKYTYDNMGNISEILKNQQVTKIKYNIFSSPVLIIYPDNTREEFIYNLNGTLKSFIDKEGYLVNFEYDFLKRKTKKQVTNKDNEIIDLDIWKYNLFDLVEKQDKRSITRYYYDFAKRKIKEEKIYKDIIFTTAYFYDNFSQNCKTVYNDELIELTKRDILGRVTEVEKKDKRNNLLYKRSYQYDACDNVLNISYIDGNESLEKHIFDSHFRIYKIIDPIGNITTYRYDDSFFDFQTDKILKVKEADRIALIEKRNPKAEVFYREENSYDNFNNLTSVKKTAFVDGEKQIKQIDYSYDEMNRANQKVDRENNSEKITKYSYTKKGYVEKILTSKNVVIEKKYDYFGNVLSLRTSDDLISYEFEYNSFNLPVKIKDLINKTEISRKYSSFGKLVEEKMPNGLVLRKDYDHFARIKNVYCPDLTSIEYFYNPLYMEKVIRKDKDDRIIYSHNYLNYDLSGYALREELIGDLELINYQRRSLGKKDLLDKPFGISKIQKRDLLGRPEKISWNVFYETNDTTFYYDDFDRVKNLNFKYIKEQKDGNITYDALNRAGQVREGDLEFDILYDGLNRKITKNIYKNVNGKRLNVFSIKYLYDELEEIAAFDDENRVLESRILGYRENDKNKVIALEVEGEIYAPLYDIDGSLGSLVSLNKGAVTSYDYNTDNSFFVSALKKYFTSFRPKKYFISNNDEDINLKCLSSLDDLEKNQGFFVNLSEPLRNVILSKIQGETSFKERPTHNITSIEVKLDPLWSNIFAPKYFFKDEEENKIIMTFSREVIDKMALNDNLLKQIILTLKNAYDVQKIQENVFLVSSDHLEVLIDLDKKEIINVEEN